MSATSTDFLIECRSQWGVRRIHGCLGDGTNGIVGALGRVAERKHLVHLQALPAAPSHDPTSPPPGSCTEAPAHLRRRLDPASCRALIDLDRTT